MVIFLKSYLKKNKQISCTIKGKSLKFTMQLHQVWFPQHGWHVYNDPWHGIHNDDPAVEVLISIGVSVCPGTKGHDGRIKPNIRKYILPAIKELYVIDCINITKKTWLSCGNSTHFHKVKMYNVHPWKLTWHWKIPIFNRKYIFIHGGFSSQSC